MPLLVVSTGTIAECGSTPLDILLRSFGNDPAQGSTRFTCAGYKVKVRLAHSLLGVLLA